MLDFDSYFSVDHTGRGDNLALFWRTTFNCQIVNFYNNHIIVDIVDPTCSLWKFTGYYGYLNGGQRRAACDFLRQLSSQMNAPWCIFRDFNDIFGCK